MPCWPFWLLSWVCLIPVIELPDLQQRDRDGGFSSTVVAVIVVVLLVAMLWLLVVAMTHTAPLNDHGHGSVVRVSDHIYVAVRWPKDERRLVMCMVWSTTVVVYFNYRTRSLIGNNNSSRGILTTEDVQWSRVREGRLLSSTETAHKVVLVSQHRGGFYSSFYSTIRYYMKYL